jgi:two-component SAPR family response regulator
LTAYIAYLKLTILDTWKTVSIIQDEMDSRITPGELDTMLHTIRDNLNIQDINRYIVSCSDMPLEALVIVFERLFLYIVQFLLVG